MWCDFHAVRRWEWEGSSSDHCCGQEATAGTEGELGRPRRGAQCALDADKPFLWLMTWSGTNRQASGCLRLWDGWKRTPVSRAFLAFCYWFSRGVHESSIWHIWVQDGPTCKLKACGWRDPLSAKFSVEAWPVRSLWLWVLWLLDLTAYTWSAMWPGWLSSHWHASAIAVVGWALYLISSNLPLTCHVDSKDFRVQAQDEEGLIAREPVGTFFMLPGSNVRTL